MSRAEVDGASGEPDGIQQAPGRIGCQYLACPGTAGVGAAGTRYEIYADGRLVDWGPERCGRDRPERAHAGRDARRRRTVAPSWVEAAASPTELATARRAERR